MTSILGRRARAIAAAAGAVVVLGAFPAQADSASTGLYYQNCDAVRAAGAAPVYRGESGYGAHLDRDGDGIGCEVSGGGGGSSGGSSGEAHAMVYGTQVTFSAVVSDVRGVRASGEMARTLNGFTVGTAGVRLALEVLQESTWVKVGDVLPGTEGAIDWPVSGDHRAGSRFRLVYPGSTLPFPFTDPPARSSIVVLATSAPTPAVPTSPTARVQVKATSDQSKLRVDVNPDRGKGYWRFQVQKERAGGSWKALKTYKTKGKKETRTVNLKRGTYRVVVKPKYGYGATTSGQVSLRR